ncbi:hypothetical protein C8259_18495 [Nocardia nova]|uniref:Uncharacterized protein n=1 Tax=Nocardia nova TaxID=37330 RepID=A0A2T2Z193_9NOCA|nr:hypothetical protein C8259_18495 [Nocardia nova]
MDPVRTGLEHQIAVDRDIVAIQAGRFGHPRGRQWVIRVVLDADRPVGVLPHFPVRRTNFDFARAAVVVLADGFWRMTTMPFS